MRSPGFGWMGMAGLGIASLAMLGSGALGGAVGSLLAGYAMLLGVGALYLFATLTVQERAVQRVRGRHPLPASASLRAHGHRVF